MCEKVEKVPVVSVQLRLLRFIVTRELKKRKKAAEGTKAEHSSHSTALFLSILFDQVSHLNCTRKERGQEERRCRLTKRGN